MPNFFKSFFSGKSEDPENEKQKTAKKNFEIFSCVSSADAQYTVFYFYLPFFEQILNGM